jgi:hypothetical protein
VALRKPSRCQTTIPTATALVFTAGDQEAVQHALSNWSPISTTSVGTKQTRSVKAHVHPKDISTLLQRLGKALEGDQPMNARITIEL